MKAVLDLIGNDQLDEAIELLSKVSSEIDEVLKELVLLKSRLTNLNRSSRKGILRAEEKEIQKNKIRDSLIELTFQLKKQIKNLSKESNVKPINTNPKYPFPEFNQDFREVVAPHFISSSKSYLHIVFGNISKIKSMNIAVGCSQDFDMEQSHLKSALGSLWNIEMNNRPLLKEIDNLWKKEDRPKSSGLGTSKFVELSKNSNDLKGVIFTVTTRDISNDFTDKGLYTKTPVEGIPIVLSKVFEEVTRNKLSSIALPLLGAGFANIARTFNNPELKFDIEKSILAITIDESLNYLIGDNEELNRIVIVIFSNKPQSGREHQLWELSIKMLTPSSEKRLKIIDKLIEKIK